MCLILCHTLNIHFLLFLASQCVGFARSALQGASRLDIALSSHTHRMISSPNTGDGRKSGKNCRAIFMHPSIPSDVSLYHKVLNPPKQPGIGVDLFQQDSFMDQIWRGITYEFITQSNAPHVHSCPTLLGDDIAHGWL